jgi:hypothetical protein
MHLQKLGPMRIDLKPGLMKLPDLRLPPPYMTQHQRMV